MHNHLQSATPNADRFGQICNAPYQPRGGFAIDFHTSVSLPYNPHSNFVLAPIQNVGYSGSACPVGTCPVNTYKTGSNQPQPFYSSSNNYFNGN